MKNVLATTPVQGDWKVGLLDLKLDVPLLLFEELMQ